MAEVVSLMCLHRFSGLPVIDEDGTLQGIIAEKDVLYYRFPDLTDRVENMTVVNLDETMGGYQTVLKMNASDLLTRNVCTVSPDLHVMDDRRHEVRDTESP